MVDPLWAKLPRCLGEAFFELRQSHILISICVLGLLKKGPGGSGRTWGGAGHEHPAFLVPVLRSYLHTYSRRWPRCLGRPGCCRALPLSCSLLYPCRALPAPLPRLSGSPCPTLFPRWYSCLLPAFLPAPCPNPAPPPLASAHAPAPCAANPLLSPASGPLPPSVDTLG